MNKSQTRTLAVKRIAVAVATVCATLTMPAIAGDDVKALLDLMLKKGVITQSDYDQFLNATADSAENKAFKEKRIEDDVAKSNKFVQQHEKDGSVKPSGLGWVSADGKNEINLTGRLHFDARMSDNAWGKTTDRDSGSAADRFGVRRARLGVNGVFNKDFTYEMITNLTGATTNTGATNSTAVVDTAWVNYMLTPEAQWRFGRMKQPLALETLTSSNNIDFMERSYLDQLAPGKQNGMMFHGEKDGIVYAFSGWQNGYDPITSSNGLAPQFGGRVATNIANVFGAAGNNAVFHVGLSGMVGKQEVTPVTSSQKGSTFETKGAFVVFRDENLGISPVFRDRIYGSCPYGSPKAGGQPAPDCSATANGYGLPAQDAAQVDKVMAAFEAAYATGPLKVQYEYADAKLTAKSQAQNAAGTSTWSTESSGHAKVQYISFMYNLTGEEWKDTYKSGLFGSIKPKSNFNVKDGSGTGAWQLGLRMSQYDASSFGASTTGTLPADEETTGSNGKQTCSGSGSNNCYQLGGSPKGTTYTLGVNWILNPNSRVMLNYSHTQFDTSFYPIDTGTASSRVKAADHSDMISLRTQFNF